jgi:hypothetical protein
MKTKSEKMLPKTVEQITNGGIYSQRVRCGKSRCKCSRGESHQAYYFFTRRNGKLVKFYIRKAEFQQFTFLVVQANSEREKRRRVSKDNVELLRRFRCLLRDK